MFGALTICYLFFGGAGAGTLLVASVVDLAWAKEPFGASATGSSADSARPLRRIVAHAFLAGFLAVAFGVLSLCAGSVPTVLDALRVGILGGAVFLICEVLLHSILDRISSGAAGKYPRSMAVVSALLLWLAAQILMSIGI